jgi:hypothetical protein
MRAQHSRRGSSLIINLKECKQVTSGTSTWRHLNSLSENCQLHAPRETNRKEKERLKYVVSAKCQRK